MNAVMSVLTSVGKMFYAVGLKEPWKMTGVRSIPEYLHYMPNGMEYRAVAPASQIDKVQAIIPHDSPRLVYDIKYAPRDYRRHNKYTSRTVDAKAPLDLDKMFASAPVLPAEVKEIARPPIMPNRGF